MGSSQRMQISDIVPSNIEVNNWVVDGEMARCNNHGELARLINGGAVFFIDRGVKSAVFQDYINKHRNTYLNLELYQADSSAQVAKILDDSYMEHPVFLTDIGENIRMANRLIGVYFVDFYKDNIYVKLTITEKTDQSRQEIIDFAKAVYNKI